MTELEPNYTVDSTVREHLRNIPGIGDNTRTFKIRAQMTPEQVSSLKENFGIDAYAQTRNVLCQETAMYMQRQLDDELRKIEPTNVPFDELKWRIAKEKSVVVNTQLGTKFMDEREFTPAPSQSRSNSPVSLIGKYMECDVYVNVLVPFSDNRAFVIRDNVVSMRTVSEGRISERGMDTILLEGTYVVFKSDNNEHYTVVV